MLNFQKTKEKRKFPRVGENCMVNFSLVEKDHFIEENREAFAKNISGGGICFSSNSSVADGAMVALEIYLPDFPSSVMAFGKVVRCDSIKKEGRFEVAVEFWWIGWASDNFQQKMGDFIRDKLKIENTSPPS